MPRLSKSIPDPATPRCLGTLFRDACARFARRSACLSDAGECTYGELRGRVAARTADWRSRGVEAGDRIAFLGENTEDFLELYFAAAWMGAVLVPLNHRLSARELREILADCQSRLFLWEPVFDSLAREVDTSPEALVLEAPRANAEEDVPLAQVDPDSPAQLYYTSGTTGRPKGVILTHANVVAHARTVIAELGLEADDRWGHFAPMFHLADAWACFAITDVGGTHVLPGRFDARKALENIAKHRVTRTNLVPTMLAAMLALEDVSEFDYSSLRMLLSGGAPIAPALVRKLLQTFGCSYVQTYGMTETSPFLTLGLLTDELAALPEAERLALISRTGRPFAGVQLEVVDSDDREVPHDDATVGEIRARGPSVSPGYWQRPDETARAFRDGWLYTGDLAVVDAHGYLNIVDRKKDVILTGGENVYSTEVESILLEHPAVLEVAVIGLTDERWGERVHAVCALRPGRQADEDELIEFCRRHIAKYKAPRSLSFLEQLPKTGSGKIAKHRLRRALQEPDGLAT